MHSQRLIRAVGVVLVLVAGVAHAQAADWLSTFTEASLAPSVQAGVTRVIVVAAGADRIVAKEATTAIEQRLRGLSAALVMGDEALGAVSDLDDATIVSRSAPMPVDRVIVVRVFPGGPGAQPSAVAIAYAKDGTVVTALSGARGQAIAASAPIVATPAPLAPAAVAPAPSGVDSRAADAVSEITRDHRRNHEDAQRQYDEQYVAFNEMAAVTSSGGVVATWSIPYQGKYRKPLDGVNFYLAVGRQDLVGKYRGKRALKIGLIVSGIAVGALGLGLSLYGLANLETDECEEFLPVNVVSDDHCLRYKRDYTFLYVGGGLYVAGMVTMLVGIFMNPHPIEPTEARRVADEYNQRLRQRLGLSRETAALQIPEAPKARFSWNTYASQQGAGLTLRLDL